MLSSCNDDMGLYQVWESLVKFVVENEHFLWPDRYLHLLGKDVHGHNKHYMSIL